MNLLRLPGLIDIHVHLRDPGETHKEDFFTGTSAALAGGITTVFDMPNNREPIFSVEKLLEKKEIAAQKAVCDWGLYFGTDGKNTAEFEQAASQVIGLKLYLNATTGNLSIEDESLIEKIFQTWPAAKPIVVHTEGERIDLVIRLAQLNGRRLHITHVHEKQILEKIIEAKRSGVLLTCDVTPHHLFLTSDSAAALQGFAIVKPPIRSKEDCEFLWHHLDDIDCIATDHAPHTKEEKSSANPPSGVPGLETMLPLLLTAVSEKKMTIEDIIHKLHDNPMRIFGISDQQDTYVEVDPDEQFIITESQIKTKCGWSPFASRKVKGRVKRVILRGTKVFENGNILTSPGSGKEAQIHS